ncbi:MAG: glycosyltransferase family 2 protein [Bacteroidota bacterium]
MALSVIITTYNEEDNIRGVLETVQWADEIMVVDSFSTDATVAIAKEYTDFVVQRAYQGPADQKNWAIPQVAHPWILLLDADERVTPELRAEVEGYLAKEQVEEDAFWIGRRNFFLGQEVRYSGWQGDAVVRFFRRDRCRYNEKQVHEEIELDGLKVGRLGAKMIHNTYKDMSHYLDKVRRYAKWSAQDYAAKTKRVGAYHLLGKPIFRFFKHYVVQQGFRDGRLGLILSLILAWSVFLRYVYLLEQRKKP